MIYCPHCKKPTAFQTGLCRHCGSPIPHEVMANATARLPKPTTPLAVPQTQTKSKPRRLLLGEILVGAGLLASEHLSWALVKQQETGGRLGTILVDNKLISDAHLIQALSHQSNLRWIDLRSLQIDDGLLVDLLKLIPLDLAEKHLLFPLDVRQMEDGSAVLFLAMDDPHDTVALDAAQAATGMRVKPLFATPSAITATIQIYRDKQVVAATRTDRWPKLSAEPKSVAEPQEPEKPAAAEPAAPMRTRALALPASLFPPRSDESPPDGSAQKMLTLLDGTTIPWANETQKGFIEEGTGIEFFQELASLDVDPDGIIRTRQYVAAMLRIMFKKQIIAPEDFGTELEKFSLDPQP